MLPVCQALWKCLAAVRWAAGGDFCTPLCSPRSEPLLRALSSRSSGSFAAAAEP